MNARQAVGLYGEKVAARHLESAGMHIVARRWRCALGELDLVALDGNTLVAIEVKTRRTNHFGHPLESITPTKAARLRRLLMAWVDEHQPDVAGVRVDAVAVVQHSSGAPEVGHYRGIA